MMSAAGSAVTRAELGFFQAMITRVLARRQECDEHESGGGSLVARLNEVPPEIAVVMEVAQLPPDPQDTGGYVIFAKALRRVLRMAPMLMKALEHARRFHAETLHPETPKAIEAFAAWAAEELVRLDVKVRREVDAFHADLAREPSAYSEEVKADCEGTVGDGIE